MSSSINYRFRSMKNFAKINFEGNSLPLWELRSEIITQKKITSKDFDLIFYDAETNEEINDEYQPIYRNSQIIIERIPAWMSKNRNITYVVKSEDKQKSIRDTSSVKKYFKPPPPNYVCFRCGQKGHFIQHCPTNQDKNYDILRIRKPTGIPKAFLVPVKDEEIPPTAAMLVTPEAGYVKAQPQTHEWQKISSKTSEYDISNDLKCSKCKFILNNPVKTDCNHKYCDGCIFIGDRCTVCDNIVSNLSDDLKTKFKIEKFFEKQ
ncbi:DWNN domain-containing protein [Hamiltosporidium tvaerminnensis]|uniref:DWNN domain-containing protein n=1 Tax=Hamiltosporidium tvaerminnensis TaxID=1176355 RepID=A0A4Q9M258_9MICR|nr:DWNN domain-containing protein [Hamiltosporidium tvaerminnensis]